MPGAHNETSEYGHGEKSVSDFENDQLYPQGRHSLDIKCDLSSQARQASSKVPRGNEGEKENRDLNGHQYQRPSIFSVGRAEEMTDLAPSGMVPVRQAKFDSHSNEEDGEQDLQDMASNTDTLGRSIRGEDGIIFARSSRAGISPCGTAVDIEGDDTGEYAKVGNGKSGKNRC